MSMGGTGIQSGRNVGTAQRLTTGQRRQVNFGGVGMEHDVQVSNRPVTGKIGGMMGMRVKTAGPQRQVQDNTYWLGVLRAKCDEIKQETDKHKQSIEQHNKDSTTYATLERKYESYIKEVRGLEGQLADYNLSMDKTRAGTNPNEILQFQMALRSKNSDHRRDVDDVFEAKNEKHQLIHKCENEIANIHEMAEQKIQKLDPHRQQHYKNMMEKNIISFWFDTISGRYRFTV
jgi:intraflagellar transport protein 74